MPSPPISILQPLSPRVFVLQSEDVREACAPNGCAGLEEIVRPWEGSVERVSVLSSTLTPSIHPSFPLRFVAFESVYHAQALGASSPSTSRSAWEDPDLVTDIISSLVAKNKPEQELHYPITRSVLLASRPELAPHETFNHPLCFMIAVSTANQEPISSFAKLYHQSLSPGSATSAWVDTTNCLRFYVLVHDVSRMGEAGQTVQNLLAQIKKTYGPHCTLLIINSRQRDDSSLAASINTEPDTLIAPTAILHPHPSTPSPRSLTPDEPPSAISEIYAAALSSLTLSPLALASNPDPGSVTRVQRKTYGAAMDFSDAQRVAALIRELVVQSLVPWMEGRVREWNETYLANRRGITGRLFGAGRKFFGSRPASPAPGQNVGGYNTVKGYYPAASTEALSRRLADVAFMLRDFKLAASVYDSIRRDYAQDRAWRYSASATEMYGLSLLLSHQYFLPSSPPTISPNPFTNLQHTEISSWLEQSIMAYTSRSPPLQLDAMRATILYHEAWRVLGETRGVSQALMRAAGDMEEVPSAVLVEEAAQADVNVPPRGGHKPKRRRQAFHLVMAARRYEKSGHKSYSRRCLERAALLYKTAPWTAAQDHIEYALGRQAYTLGESAVAVEHFLRLLRKEDDVGGVVSSGAQRGVLDDLALAYEQLAARPDSLANVADKLVLPTPIFDVAQTSIRIQSSSSKLEQVPTSRWLALEEQFIAEGWKSGEHGRKPSKLLNDTTTVVAAVDEPFFIDLVASNPLNAPLSLFNLTAAIDGGEVQVETIPEVQLAPLESRSISLRVTATSAGRLQPVQVDFSFHNILPCTQSLEKRGKRLFATKQDRLTPTYAKDKSLEIEVSGARPRIQINLELGSEPLYQGEIRRGSLAIVNTGSTTVTGLRMLVSEPGWLRFSGSVSSLQSGAELDNRISNNTPVGIPMERLDPGSEQTVPVECIGGRTGLDDILLLIAGHSTTNPDELVCTQVVHSVETLSLIGIHALSSPSKRQPGSYMINLEVSSDGSEAVQVQSVSAISPFWHFQGERDMTAGPSTLPGQSTCRLLRFAGPATLDDVQGLDLEEKTTLDQLSALLEGRPLGDVHPRTRLLVDEDDLDRDRYLAARKRYRLASLAATMPAIPHRLHASIFPLVPPFDLDLAVRWSIPGKDREGISYLHGIKLAPYQSVVEPLRAKLQSSDGTFKRTMYEETDRLQRELVANVMDGELGFDQDPIDVAIKVDARRDRGILAHDFSTGPCEVPISFLLRNQSPILPCRWLLRVPERSKPGVNAAAVQPHFVGRLCHRGELAAYSTASPTATAWIYEPGLYTLGGWELSSETGRSVDGEWLPRASWTRSGDGFVLEVVHA